MINFNEFKKQIEDLKAQGKNDIVFCLADQAGYFDTPEACEDIKETEGQYLLDLPQLYFDYLVHLGEA